MIQGSLYLEPVCRLLDRVAALQDAPDRTSAEWFYNDLAQLMGEAIDDALVAALADELDDLDEPAPVTRRHRSNHRHASRGHAGGRAHLRVIQGGAS